MTVRRVAVLALMLVCVTGFGFAQDGEPPLKNWAAPPYWNPTVQPRVEGDPSGMLAHAQGMQAQAEALPSSPLPFVAITPCRIVDTRVAVSDGFHQPNFADDEARTFDLPASTACTGLPATAGAWSLNIQFRPISQLSYLTTYPTGTTMPGVSTMTAGPAAWVQNAAIVPAGTGGAIDIYCQYAGRVVIDINGYYGPQSVVTSLNTLTGDLTLAGGSNIAITPSGGNTLTIAMTGVPGGTLPGGSTGQTLYSNGSGWVASSVLTNDGVSNVGVGGNLNLPATTSTASGVITFGGVPFLHEYAGPGNAGFNTFVGREAGNFTMGGVNENEGSRNTAIGRQSLYSNTTGLGNTASGYQSLYSNTTGGGNTATGFASMANNTTGFRNTATGYGSLPANSTGQFNTANGVYSLKFNTTGTSNTAIGYSAGDANYTGYDNTFVGAGSDVAIDGLTNATAIGVDAVVDNSNKVRIGNGTVTVIEGQVAWSWSSDARLKENIRDLDLGLDFVMQLRPVSFTMKRGNGRTDMGFIAQDVETLLGDQYNVLGMGADPDRTLSLRGTDLIAPLVRAIQEQQAMIEELTKKIVALERKAAAKP